MLPVELMRQWLMDSPDGEAWLDAQGRLTWVNPAITRITGYPAPECLALTDFPASLVLHTDQALFESLRSASHTLAQPAQGKLRLQRQDGAINWVSISWQPLWNALGQRLGTRVSLSDASFEEHHTSSQRDHLIAFRREATRIIRQASTQGGDFKAMCDVIVAQAAQALQVNRIGIWLFDGDGQHLNCVSLYLSARQHCVSGSRIAVADFPIYMAAISTDELVVANDACTHPLTRELAQGYLQPEGIASMLDAPIVQSGHTVGVLCTEHGPDMRHWAAAEIAFVDALAEFIGLQLQTQEREALQTHTRRLASIIEATPDVVFMAKVDGETTYINQAGRQMLGLAPDESLEGVNAMDFVPPDLHERRRTEIIPHVVRHGHWAGEVSVITRQGERIPIWEDVMAHRDADGWVRYLSAVVRDLRGQKRTENELRERGQALSQLNEELEARVLERTHKIEEINKNLETFAFSVSHDLKAPLRGIDGYSRLLMEDHQGQLPAEAQGFIHNIRQAAQSMSQLIDDLLAYSRIGRRELSRSHFALGAAISRVLNERHHDIQTHGVQIINQVPAIELTADLDCLLQILRNLIDNAIKFTRQSGPPTVTLSATLHPDRIVLSVKDNGCGFDMKYHDRIFAIFQRLHRTEDYPGTGVGLAIVSKAAERLGGRIWASSTPGNGADFSLELPRQHG